MANLTVAPAAATAPDVVLYAEFGMVCGALDRHLGRMTTMPQAIALLTMVHAHISAAIALCALRQALIEQPYEPPAA